MIWHTGDIEPNCDNVYYTKCVVKTKDGMFYLTYWQSYNKFFVIDDESSNKIEMDKVDKWGYVDEDDCNTDEMRALEGIQDAVNHVQALYDILLTDGILCGKEYRDLIGLNELQVIKEKLTKRILYLEEN